MAAPVRARWTASLRCATARRTTADRLSPTPAATSPSSSSISSSLNRVGTGLVIRSSIREVERHAGDGVRLRFRRRPSRFSRPCSSPVQVHPTHRPCAWFRTSRPSPGLEVHDRDGAYSRVVVWLLQERLDLAQRGGGELLGQLEDVPLVRVHGQPGWDRTVAATLAMSTGWVVSTVTRGPTPSGLEEGFPTLGTPETTTKTCPRIMRRHGTAPPSQSSA